MCNAYLKYGLCILMLWAFSLNSLNATPTFYSGKDGNKKKATTLTTSKGLVIKQSKPNMYVRFFNRVYNKYAERPIVHPKKKKDNTAATIISR